MSTKRKTTEQFISEAKKIHNDIIYDKVDYKNEQTKVCLICSVCGNEFWQTPKAHLRGQGCPKCGLKRNKKHDNRKHFSPRGKAYTQTEIIELIDKIYDKKYDTSKVKYVNRSSKLTLICPIHGDFTKSATDLINKKTGCPICNNEHKREIFSLGRTKFIEKSNDIFHGEYGYDHVDYINNSTKVKITCFKHGDFLCTPANHLKGRGCPICKSENNVYEERLYHFLLTVFDEKDIKRQYKDLWLSDNKSLDFYIDKYKIAIEHQGSQHFKYVPFLYNGDIKKFERTIHNDINKKYECEANDVKLLYFTYELNKVDIYFDTVYTKEEDLKNKILDIIKKEK